MARSIKLNIGDVAIAISGNSGISDWEIDRPYLPFITNVEPDIKVNMVRGIPDDARAKKYFGSYPIWDLYRSNGNSIIKFYPGHWLLIPA